MTRVPATVLHFIDSGGLYGAESVLLNLSREMQASGRYWPIIGSIVGAPDEPDALHDKALELGFAAEKLVVRNGRLPLDLPRAAARLRALGVDLIHSHGYKPSVFGALMAGRAGAGVTATCHLWYKGDDRPLKMRAMIAAELRFYRRFRRVVAVSAPIRDELVRAGVPAGRIAVIENGVAVGDEAAPPPAAVERIRAELGLDPACWLLVNTGRLTAQKAQADLVDAVGLLRAAGRAVQALIVGEGELESELKARIARADLEDHVRLLGFRDDVAALLRAADAFVLPSLDEGMPMSLLEAAAAGLPAVVTPVGDIPRLIEDRVSGLVVPSGDPAALAAALAGLMDAPDRGRGWADEARRRVEETYSNQAMFTRYERIYAEYGDTGPRQGGDAT
ncbi:glycosyltransferase [bacterium]|nr:glycosyltransferase [bacterium]